MTIELLGAQKAAHDLSGIAARLDDATAIMRREAHVLEVAERGTFAELDGRYVDTGTTLRSLTLPDAPYAIRRATRSALEFGTSVRYARYLTETIGPHGERPKPVAVLKLSPVTRQQVAHDVMDQVVGQGGGPLGGAMIGGML
jgi:hypothetical protein